MGQSSSRWSHRLDIVANVALIAACVAISAVAARSFTTPPAPGPPLVAVGEQMLLENVDWTGAARTLVMVLDEKCRYCEASTPFHRVLVDAAKDAGVPVLAVFPDTRPDGQSYLTKNGLDVPRVIAADFQAVKLAVTPLVLLVDKEGEVRHVWRGLLSPDQEAAALSTVKF